MTEDPRSAGRPPSVPSSGAASGGRPAGDGTRQGAATAGPTARAGEERVVIRNNRKIDVTDDKAAPKEAAEPVMPPEAMAGAGVAEADVAEAEVAEAEVAEAEVAEADVAEADVAEADVAEAPAEVKAAAEEAAAEGESAAGEPAGSPLRAESPLGAELEALRAELDERTKDLQRVSAEFANYRKRVDRDRALVVEQATGHVLSALLPVLDDLDRARDHGDLVGPFGAVAEQLVTALNKFGLSAFGAEGDRFDPTRHEAVSHSTSTEVTEPTCVTVMRRGYLLGERLLRPAMVAVADPE